MKTERNLSIYIYYIYKKNSIQPESLMVSPPEQQDPICQSIRVYILVLSINQLLFVPVLFFLSA